VALTGEGGRTPNEYRGLQVMIPKPGKPTNLAKSWRPIVLANTVGKLAQEVIADDLQFEHSLFPASNRAHARDGRP